MKIPSTLAAALFAPLLALSILCSPTQSSGSESAPAAIAPTTSSIAAGKSATVQIAGMTCASCAKSVTQALKKLTDVDQVVVDLRKNQATVTLKAGAVLDESAIRLAVDQAGYQVKKVIAN